ncbi:M48 family metalloprotease [uncultured Paracoccus sp.]|uniref:M48 family metalloprotease n=1 Tax=uncultured Paracoccus sp. TaxID=189685 RepID=UPI002617F245|nr:M48 family metalloprotease [uncultured Paracoccus sp.]
MMTVRTLAAGALMATILSGCVAPVVVTQPARGPVQVPVARTQPEPAATAPAPAYQSPEEAARSFVTVIRTMEPAIERECLLRRTTPINCDYQFVVDDRPGLEPNAFQTIGRDGRPVIGFTLSLLAAAQNDDEIAFVVGHEASHHILNHLSQRQNAASAGAVILTGIAAASGVDPSSLEVAQRVGAQVGARYYSKEWELQSDYLGAIIAFKGGYDPARGARFFARMPDPGDRILGSHPSRAAREQQVTRAVADVMSGRAS